MKWPMGDLLPDERLPADLDATDVAKAIDAAFELPDALTAAYVEFVGTVAPAWAADGRPIYGGFFWINGIEHFPIPKEAYFMAGAGGQYTVIIPSHDMVVVRLGQQDGHVAPAPE